jgi:hypothetical protein
VRVKQVNTGSGQIYGHRFICPGCREEHVVGTAWTYNGDPERPTFEPSIKVTGGPDPKYCCHSFVRDGRIEFLSDCSHAMAGQIVELPEIT